MEILDLVAYVNKKLSDGFSTSKLEKEMQLGKDTLRKKLNRAGYKFSKDLKQYIKEELVTLDNTVSYRSESDVYNSKEEKLNAEEINFIKMLYKQHQQQKNLNNTEIDEVIVRSIRVSKKSMDLFSTYCKNNKLNQTKALSKALLDFIKNN